MDIDRDKFLSALVALSLTTAASGCGSEPPPAAEEPAPAATAGAEQPAQPAPPPAAPQAAPEPVPEVQPAGPTRE